MNTERYNPHLDSQTRKEKPQPSSDSWKENAYVAYICVDTTHIPNAVRPTPFCEWYRKK